MKTCQVCKAHSKPTRMSFPAYLRKGAGAGWMRVCSECLEIGNTYGFRSVCEIKAYVEFREYLKKGV